MNKLLELRQKHGKVIADIRAIVEGSSASGFTSDERTKFDALDAEESQLRQDIQRIESAEKLLKASEDRKEIDAKQARDTRDPQARYNQAFETLLRYGGDLGRLSAEDREVVLRNRTSADEELRTLSIGTGAAGGFTISTGFRAELEQKILTFGGMFSFSDSLHSGGGMQANAGIRILRTSQGNTIQFPNGDDTLNVGAILAESASIGASVDPVFSQFTLSAYMYHSKPVIVPVQLMDDTEIPLQSLIAGWLATRLARIWNTHFTNGTGTGQPLGVVTASGVGKVGTTGQTLSVIYDDLVDLQHSVDRAYRQNGMFMMSDAAWKVVRKLKDTTGRPLINQQDQAITDGFIPQLLGRPVIINDDVPVMAANAKSILFGDFSKYIARFVKDLVLFPFRERYMDNLQLGWVAYQRADGKLRDAGSTPIKYYQNSAT
jgi:HK97 family phage major capsid protein